MKNINQPIAIIGGMGPQASAKLLEVIVGMCSKDFGAKDEGDFPEIILNSIPVPNFISDKENVNLVLEILKKKVKNLEQFNPSCFAIACNTAHLLLDDLQPTTNIKFISIINEVATCISKSGIKKVGILATPTTISSALYQNALKEKRIIVISPTLKEIIEVEKIIRNVLGGKILDSDRNKLVNIASSLASKGAQGIILGCTELPLIFPKSFPLPIFDSIEILALALVTKAYGRNKYE